MGTIKYLLAQEKDYLWGAVTKTIGIQTTLAGAPYPSVSHPKDYLFTQQTGRILSDLHIVYITQGVGWFESAHCPRTKVQSGDAFLLFPGEWHNYAPDREAGWTEEWIGFSGSYADLIVSHNFFDISHPILRVGLSDTICNAFEQAFLIAQKELPAHQQQLAGYVSLIVTSIYAKSIQHPYKDTPESDYVNRARNYMRENLHKCLYMEDVAKEIGLGYSKFRKIFRNYTGFPPTQYFLNLKLEKSRDYLSGSDLSCKEVAFRLGFDSTSYFIKLFQQHYGTTPGKYRSQFNH